MLKPSFGARSVTGAARTTRERGGRPGLRLSTITVCVFLLCMGTARAAVIVAVGPVDPAALPAEQKATLASLAAGALAVPGLQVIRVDDSSDSVQARDRALQSRADYLIALSADVATMQLVYDSYRPGPNVKIGHIVRSFKDASQPITPTEQAALFPSSHKRTLLIAPETAVDNGLADKDFINAYLGALLNEKNVASYAATIEFNQFQTPTLAQQAQQAQLQVQAIAQRAQLMEMRRQTSLMMSLSVAMLAQQHVMSATSTTQNTKQGSRALGVMNDALKQLNDQIKAGDANAQPAVTFRAASIGEYAAELCRIYSADGVFVWHVARATYSRKLLGQYTTDVAMKGQQFDCNAEQVWSAKGTGQKNAFTGLGAALVSTFNLAVAFKPKLDSVNAQNAKPLVSPYLDLTDAADKPHFDYDAIRIAIEKIVGQYPGP